jgi:hypothetical protein
MATFPPMKNIPQSIYQQALMGGILLLAGYLAMYVISFDMMISGWSSLFVLATVVVVMVKGLRVVRVDEGSLSFKRGFGLALLGGWLARAGYNVFNLLLFSVLKPGLKKSYADSMIEKTEESMAGFGVDLKSMEAMGVNLDDIHLQVMNSLTPWGQFKDWFFSVIVIAILALIVAAFLKTRHELSE